MSAPRKSLVVAKIQDMTLNPFSHPKIDNAFAERPDLKQRIYNTIPILPGSKDLFVDLAEFFVESRQGNHLHDDVQNPSKKRKLHALQGAGGSSERIMFEAWKQGFWGAIPDISFSIPQRKKLRMEVGFSAEQGLRARNVATDEIEFAVRWKDIQHVTCLPVPEKAQAQYIFCVFPVNADGIHTPSDDTVPAEQILWTVPNTTLKTTQVSGSLSIESEDTYRSLLIRILNRCLAPLQKQVVVPNEKEFASPTTQTYRKGEKAVHVKAFRGSKDGFLFFLPTGIFWGFKKPLIYFSFDIIHLISYTSVLQRTFNLSLTTRSSCDATTQKFEFQEFEFSMIDQADFNGIDAYVKRHGLQDGSLAEQRRAKMFNVNGGVKGEADGQDGNEGGNGDGEGELEKARREMEDAEDEDEEDDENFDPGSEGSGSSSEEEEGERGGEGEEGSSDDEGSERDLVKQELGSEAEGIEDE